MNKIDLKLSVKLPPQNVGFEKGAQDFIALLDQLKGAPGFDVDWFAQWQDAGPRISLANDQELFLEEFRQANAALEDGFSIWAHEKTQRLYDLKYRWNKWNPDHLLGEVYRPHPDYNQQLESFYGLISNVIGWKRPQHLSFGPGNYARDHHPLDRSRSGIRWIGWVPFALNPSDVPEAELVQPMNGGSLIATQLAFWQAFERHPYYSKEAIERAQEVEIRLNLLGVLPTTLELDRGDWGARSDHK